MGNRMGFTKPEDWYLCRYDDFDIHRLKSIRRNFGDSVSKTIIELFPEFKLDPVKFTGVSKTQDRIYGILNKKVKNKVGCKINAAIEKKIYNLEPNFLPYFVFGSIYNNDLTTFNC